MEEWKFAKSKVKKKRGSNRPQSRENVTAVKGSTHEKHLIEIALLDPAAVLKNITSTAYQLQKTQIYTHTQSALTECCHNVSKIIILGVGNFSTSPSSALQMSYIRGVTEQLIPAFKHMIFYDPIMNINESNACALLNVTCFDTAMQAKLHYHCETDSECVLFFMPHCPYQLYNEIIWRNWGLNLKNIIIIGNR